MAVIRRLEGVTYWAVEGPAEIADYINVNLRKEWEADAKSEGKDPHDSEWLRTLANRRWRLDVTGISKIKLNPELMNYVDSRTGYNFAKRLEERTKELRKEIEISGRVIPPIILRAEDSQLMDGYCRYSTLKNMGTRRTYAYIGNISS